MYSWSDANALCVSLGGKLYTPTSGQEAMDLSVEHGSVWTELTDFDENGIWTDFDGQPSYPDFWCTGEPFPATDLCAYIRSTGCLANRPCYISTTTLCVDL
ncbi:C-type lectin domain family 4 member M-like [Penaeus japonicus]|uniref:C-type lectin domain family 4 member M-like n=1 Tax=Penaeus japonicus TaxID=27405 RepID=UPI001C712EDB|nr:C-type lectin domain family 4 member M-like [Penaeus japonicus]